MPSDSSSQPSASNGRPYRSHKSPACSACRRRKSRCISESEGARCLFCRLRGSECSLESLVPEAGPGTVKAKRRSRRISPAGEASPLQAGVAVELAGDPATVYSEENEVFRIVGPLATLDKQVVSDRIGAEGYEGDVTASTLHRFQRTNRSRPGENLRSSAGSTALQTLKQVVRPQNVSHLVDIYFRIIQPSLPILNEAVVKDSLAHENPDPALLCSILTIASVFWKTTPSLMKLPVPDMEWMWNRSIEALNDGFRAPSLSTLLAAIIDLNGRPILNIIGNEINRGRVVTLAHSLGLNRDPQDWNISEDEKVFRRRIWWAVVIHDTWSSLSHGTPQLLHTHFADVQELPLVGHVVLGQKMEDSKAHTCFLFLCKLSRILADILPRVYSVYPRSTAYEEDDLWAVEINVQHWYDDLPTWLTNSWKGSKGAVTGSLSLQLSYLAVTITLARLKLRKRRQSSQYRAQETAEPLEQCRCAAEQVVQFVIRLEIADVETFWLPYSAYHLVMSVTVLLRCAVEIKDVSTSRQCIDSCEAMLTKLRSLNEETGFDIGNICLAQCTGSVDRVKKKLETRSFDEHAETGESFEGWEIGSIFALPDLGSDGSLFDFGALEEDLGSWRQ